MVRANSLQCLLLVLSSYDIQASSRLLRLRQPQPPAGMVPPAPPAAAALTPRDMFDRMDLNKDGKVDVNEFLKAQSTGVLPIAGVPAPGAAVAPGAAPGAAAGPAPAPGPAPEGAYGEHLVPPALPQDIPEPPAPPKAPPAEPLPPPQPPKEGQLVAPPPGQQAMETVGNMTALMASAPGLDLNGGSPISAPGLPPPMPVPILPPDLPVIMTPMRPPQPLDTALMEPSKASFGTDMGSTIPDTAAATPDASKWTQVVAMPAIPAETPDNAKWTQVEAMPAMSNLPAP